MKPDIAIGKGAGDSGNEVTMPPSSPAKNNKKKYVIVGVSVVLVVFIVAGSLVGAMHMMRETHKDAFKVYSILVKGGKMGDSPETVKVDKEKRITEIEDRKQDTFILNDFNKGMSVMRSRLGSIYGCYLSAIDKDDMTPEAVESYLDAHPDGEITIETPRNDSSIPRLMPSEDPVEDRGFLSDAIRDACDELPMYWLVPAPEEAVKEAMNTDASKRSARFKRGCRVVCGLRWRWFRLRWYCYVRCSWSWGKK